MWCYMDKSHCEWAVCGYEGFLALVSLLYVGLVRFVNRLKYIPGAAATGMYPLGSTQPLTEMSTRSISSG